MFEIVNEFEKKIASFFGAPYAVATDCCTHALELSIRYTNMNDLVCPNNTYLSIPMTFQKLNLRWKFVENHWENYYHISDNIIDAAVYWKKDSYVRNSFMCISFQYKKHLNLGRGGAILCESLTDYTNLKKMSHDGRLPGIAWKYQNIESTGYHYYMTPETAQLGLEKLPEALCTDPKKWNWQDYPYLPDMKVFHV